MRRKMYATAMTAMLVTGTLMGLAVPAAERDGVTLHGDSTYDSIEKITDEDLTLKIMLAIRDGDTIKAPEELAAVQKELQEKNAEREAAEKKIAGLQQCRIWRH